MSWHGLAEAPWTRSKSGHGPERRISNLMSRRRRVDKPRAYMRVMRARLRNARGAWHRGWVGAFSLLWRLPDGPSSALSPLRGLVGRLARLASPLRGLTAVCQAASLPPPFGRGERSGPGGALSLIRPSNFPPVCVLEAPSGLLVRGFVLAGYVLVEIGCRSWASALLREDLRVVRVRVRARGRVRERGFDPGLGMFRMFRKGVVP